MEEQKSLTVKDDAVNLPVLSVVQGNSADFRSLVKEAFPPDISEEVCEFRKGSEKPVLKAAYVQESVYIGDNQLDALANIKSKEELIGDIIALLQSPVNRVVSSLQSGNHLLAGLVKTLSERE